MAYVSTYDFDIFISYAHLDNPPLPDNNSGWVDHFHKELQITLDRRVGKSQKIKIWRDNKLDGNQVFDQTRIKLDNPCPLCGTYHNTMRRN